MTNILSRRSSFSFPQVLLWLAIVLAAGLAHADDVDDLIRDEMAKQHIPGLTLAVVKDGKPIKVRGYGLANLELDVPAKPDSVFRIGSVSKQFLATAILMLANDRKLSLEDKAVKYLEGAPDIWKDITIRQLLSHTAGLVREGPAFAPLKIQSDADVIKSAYGTPLIFKPGEKWQYSNLGYFIVAEIIARVSGKPWPEFVQERIFKPLAMTASGIVDVVPIVPHRAEGYVYNDGKYAHGYTLLALRPSGAFMSSIDDLLKWDAALNAAKILPQSSLDAMWSQVKLNDGKPYPYGYGWEVTQLGSHRIVQHGGSTPGFRSYYLRALDDRLSVIVLTNNEIAASDAIGRLVFKQYVKD